MKVRAIPVAAAAAVLAGAGFGEEARHAAGGEAATVDDCETPTMYRGDVEVALPAREAAFLADPDDDSVRRAYADTLLKLGDIRAAGEVMAPLGTSASSHAGDLEFGARTAYLLGDYGRARELYGRLRDVAAPKSDARARAARGLTLTYYQTGRFDRASELPVSRAQDWSSLLAFMQAFEGEPYRIDWTGPEKVAHIGMTNDITRPGALPLVDVEVDGETVRLILDTGGDRLYLDKEIYERLGLPTLTTREASYAYTQGKTVEEPLGVAGTVTMGGVTLSNVPVVGAAWKALGQESDGVLTTQILKRFLTTVDYENRRITFRNRSAEGLSALMATFGDTAPVEVPFYMAGTHLMFAKGSLNGHAGMNYFLDSGLAASMPVIVVDQTVDFLGLAKNPIEGTPYFWSPIESHGLDGLPAGAAQALGNVLVEDDFFSRFGFMADALISHQYLWRLGSFSLDFDAMKYYFPRPPETAATGMPHNPRLQ